MPEGPEIRLAADKIAEVLVGQSLKKVSFAFERLKPFEPQLTGCLITRVDTRGKAMLTCFENDWVIYSHNQLYGRWYVFGPNEEADVQRQLRLQLETDKGRALLYSASDIEVLRHDDLHKHPFLARIGPDILSEYPTAGLIYERLSSERFRRRQLAALLLDQRFLAGLGTYLTAEILFRARLHPRSKPMHCSDEQLQNLAQWILEITRRSYRTQGVINEPELVARLQARGKLSKEEYRFSVYQREGESCYCCGTAVQRFNIGGRPMFFCPSCQPFD